MVRGLLEVHVLSANGLVDKQWVGKQDPYCKLQLGNQSYRTTTASDGGTKPVWNERFQFQVRARGRAHTQVHTHTHTHTRTHTHTHTLSAHARTRVRRAVRRRPPSQYGASAR